MTQYVLALFWSAGCAGCVLFLLYGAYLVLDFRFHSTAALERTIARLSLYDSIGCRGMAAGAKNDALPAMLVVTSR